MIKALRNAIVLVGCVIAGLGCGGELGEEQVVAAGEPNGKADSIHPTGNESLGRLVLKLPDEVDNVNPTGYFSYRNTGIEIGIEKRFTSDTGCIQHSQGILGSSHAVKICDISVAAPSLTTYELAGLRIVGSNTDTTVDFGPRADLRVTENGQELVKNLWSASNYYNQEAWKFWRAATPQGYYAPLLPVTYQLEYSPPVLGEKSFEPVSGQIMDVDITPPDKRAIIKVHAPTRELPDATRTCVSANRHFLVQRNGLETSIFEPHPYDVKRNSNSYSSQRKIVAFHAFKPETEEEYRLYPFTDGEAPMHYEYVLNNIKMDLDPSPGETVDVHVQRLDVYHPVITQEDGATYEQSGSYQVLTKEGATWKPLNWLSGSYSDCSGGPYLTPINLPTGTGIDLLPGEYKVVISFSTKDGPEEQVYLCSGVPLSCSVAP